ncbi:hypothetical protein [Crenothrix polyspora]|uniref:Uncharacterized protein n=1 Tax=Crenothrix polyspora TaxID=360316 RepID=A0A1R4HAY3_9GAMM|nr:hypothetical protein [Crenothrix polyspora]SJM93383.1 conserved membrane hypothetical protein [Crenothrix polyspora]
MAKKAHYLHESCDDPVAAIVAGIDRDVEHGEDILMLGLCIVMLSASFAPVAPPNILLPLVALVFATTSSLARRNYHNMERKLRESVALIEHTDKSSLKPITTVFIEYPMPPLSQSYNILKNVKRTLKSVLGGLLINPLWMPIFYVMGIQIVEEKNLGVLNQAVMTVELKLAKTSPDKY